jgi:uncharacterized membrane protein YhaH (DUF805 family)
MNLEKKYLYVILALLSGFVLWEIASLISHKREPWDASIYWVVIYPLAIVISTMLGYRDPQRPGLLALLVFMAQFIGMCIRSGELGNLWPLGMALFAIISLPAVLTAKIAAAKSPYRSNTDHQEEA